MPAVSRFSIFFWCAQKERGGEIKIKKMFNKRAAAVIVGAIFMKITFMGTGTSQGVPVIAGRNSGLDLSNPKNWRMRTCAHIEADGKHVQIDAGPEFRIQCLKNKIEWIDVFILTHGHADHIAGMDDLRRFCDRMPANTLPVYSNEYGLERVAAMFPYALGDKPAQAGYPCFKTALMPAELRVSENLKIRSAELPHGGCQTLGLVFESGGKKLAYYTDCNAVEGAAAELAKDADILVLDFLRVRKHPSHLCVSDAFEIVRRLSPKQTFFTHTTSEIDYDTWTKLMPANCAIAYDGLTAEL